LLWDAAISTPRWRNLLKLAYNSPSRIRDHGVASDQHGALDTPRPVSSNGPVSRRCKWRGQLASLCCRGGIPGYRSAARRKGVCMEQVLGIGGVFFKARDPKALAAWYREHMGVPVEPEHTYGAFASAAALVFRASAFLPAGQAA
jgi:hypothetical protein